MGKEEIKRRVQKTAKTLPHRELIDKIYLFGSRLHGNAGPDSDIDLLVEVSKPMSFFKLYDVESALEKHLRAKVDLVTPEFLSEFFRNDVLEEAFLLYEK